MKIEWYSLDGHKREWFKGMVEATFAVGPDETVSVICDESVKSEAMMAVAVAALRVLAEELESLEAKLKEKNA